MASKSRRAEYNIAGLILSSLQQCKSFDGYLKLTIAELETIIRDRLKVRNSIRVRIILDALVAANLIEYTDSEEDAVRLIEQAVKTSGDQKSDKSGDHFSTYTEAQMEELRYKIVQWESKYKTASDELLKKDQLFNTVKGALETSIKSSQKLKEDLEELSKKSNTGKVLKVEIISHKETGTTQREVEGIFHSQFERILTLARAREEIFIYGPTGCGKSHLCEQIADALDLPFSFVSCTSGMSEGVLSGRLLPVGKGGKFEYIVSDFVKAFENGGVFFLDEIDASDANTLLSVNAALANGKFTLHNRPENPIAKRHPDFVCIAAANTFGTGADRLHSGRNKLDMATLDRFAVGKVVMDYDENLEEQLCRAQCERYNFEFTPEVLVLLRKYRRGVFSHRLERAVSTRFIVKCYKMVAGFAWTIKDIETALFNGWREDEINKVKTSSY